MSTANAWERIACPNWSLPCVRRRDLRADRRRFGCPSWPRPQNHVCAAGRHGRAPELLQRSQGLVVCRWRRRECPRGVAGFRFVVGWVMALEGKDLELWLVRRQWREKMLRTGKCGFVRSYEV